MKIKIISAVAFLFLALNLSFAQSKQWKEQEEFHKVMGATFHPAEEGNLEPFKMRSAELAAKAEAWRKSEIPSFVGNKKEVKKNLNKLCREAKKLNKNLKKGASEAELKMQLSGLHDTFHTLVGLYGKLDEAHAH